MSRIADFKAVVTAFMEEHGMSKTAFGIKAVKDPHAFFRWFEDKNGDIKFSTADRVDVFMKNYKD